MIQNLENFKKKKNVTLDERNFVGFVVPLHLENEKFLFFSLNSFFSTMEDILSYIHSKIKLIITFEDFNKLDKKLVVHFFNFTFKGSNSKFNEI
jgi:hypothetical protein